jgi:hypothetical protein
MSNKDVIVNDDATSDQSSFMERGAPSIMSRSSLRGSVRSKNNNRVQVIDDIDSDAESIEILNPNNVLEINEDI